MRISLPSKKLRKFLIFGATLSIGMACNLFQPADVGSPAPTFTRNVATITATLTPSAFQAASRTPIPDEATTPAPQASPTDTPSIQPTNTPGSDEETQTPQEAEAEVTTNAFCRAGPGTVYRDITAYEVGTVLEVDGVNPGRTWWRVVIPSTGGNCWISGSLLALSGDLNSVPELDPPPTPRPTLTATATPTITITAPIITEPATLPTATSSPSLTPPALTSPGPPPANNLAPPGTGEP